MRDADLDRLSRNLAAIPVEQRQLAAGFAEAAGKVAPLRFGRPHTGRNVRVRMTVHAGLSTCSSLTPCRHECAPLTMIKKALRLPFSLMCQADRIAAQLAGVLGTILWKAARRPAGSPIEGLRTTITLVWRSPTHPLGLRPSAE